MIVNLSSDGTEQFKLLHFVSKALWIPNLSSLQRVFRLTITLRTKYTPPEEQTIELHEKVALNSCPHANILISFRSASLTCVLKLNSVPASLKVCLCKNYSEKILRHTLENWMPESSHCKRQLYRWPQYPFIRYMCVTHDLIWPFNSSQFRFFKTRIENLVLIREIIF